VVLHNKAVLNTSLRRWAAVPCKPRNAQHGFELFPREQNAALPVNSRLGAATFALALSAVSMNAATAIGEGDFDPSAVVFDFDTVAIVGFASTDFGDFTVTGTGFS
jgi:hypothetical protein